MLHNPWNCTTAFPFFIPKHELFSSDVVCLHAPLCKQATTTTDNVPICFPFCQCLSLTYLQKREEKQILAKHKLTFNQFVIFVCTSWIIQYANGRSEWIMVMNSGGSLPLQSITTQYRKYRIYKLRSCQCARMPWKFMWY